MIKLVKDRKGLYRECGPDEEEEFIFREEKEDIDLFDIFERGYTDVAESARKKAESVQHELDELDDKIENMRKKLEEEDITAETYAEILDEIDAKNANSLRREKERANVDRHLSPKKGHHGYVLLKVSQEKVFARRDADGSGNNIIGWKLMLQTPIPAKAHIEDIIEMIEKDLISKVFHGAIDFVHCSPDEVPEAAFRDNVVYRIEFQANYQDPEPLWTITLHSVYELDISGLLE